MTEAGVSEETASEQLEKANNNLPVALLMLKENCSRQEAEGALAAASGALIRAAKLLRGKAAQ
jgi:N-acetylmuramic acid 6-phosphate (MurNAc-6-P) etherase